MEFERIADKKRLEFIVASIGNNVPAGGEILDVGCGNGIVTRALGAKGFNVLGIDVSSKTINAATAINTLPNVRFEVIGAGELKPDPLKYHAIVCSEVLEHLHHPEHLLHLLHQSLKNEGVLIVTVPNGLGPRELFVTRPIQRLQHRNGISWKMMNGLKRLLGYTGATVQSGADDLSHIQFFTLRNLRRLAKSSGFRVDIIRPSNFIEQVFPLSLVARRSLTLQTLDWRLARMLPLVCTSGFMSIWKKDLEIDHSASNPAHE